jgi:cell division transport system permease protein
MSAGDPRLRLRAWGRRQLYSFFSSLGTLLSHRLGTLMTVLVLGIAMLLPLGLWVTLQNLSGLDLQEQEWGTVTAFLQPTAGQEAAQALAEAAAQEMAVEAALVSPEQGMEEFRQRSGFGEATELFDDNPLPWVLLLTPRVANGADLEAAVAGVARWLETQQDVDMVQVDFKWLQRLSGLLALGDAFVTVLTVLFSLAVVVVVANTIRLDVAGRSHEIEVLHLVGAGRGFIRQPFLYLGFWYGLLGAVLALLLLGLCMLYLAAPLSRLLDAYGNRFDPAGLHPAGIPLILACGALLGLLGSWLAVTRYLRRFRLPEHGQPG